MLGRSIMVDGNACEIAGVLPASFEFFETHPSIVLPIRLNRADVRLINFSFLGLARLKPGVTLEQANADVTRILPMAPQKFPPNSGTPSNVFWSALIAPNL